MSVSDTSTIDFIGIGENGNCVLTITDHLGWLDAQEHLATLQEKLNTYLRFIKSGDIRSAYPDSKGKDMEIVIALRCPPPREGLDFLCEARQRIAEAAIVLSWRVYEQAGPL